MNKRSATLHNFWTKSYQKNRIQKCMFKKRYEMSSYYVSKYSAKLRLLTAKNTAEHQECMIKNKFI